MNNIPIKFAVGSESKQKLGYLNEVITELHIHAEVVPVKVASRVSEQPITSEETLIGAKNRAISALDTIQDAHYGLGMEIGYDRRKDGRYEMFCWAVVVNQEGEVAKARSHSFLLPNFHNEVLFDGRYLGDYVREYFSSSPDVITQYVAELVRGRKLFITESVRFALIYALHQEFYSHDST